MATNKLAVSMALLLCVLMAIGCSAQGKEAKEPRYCPMYCLVNAKYMTCPPDHSKPLEPACNCCIAGRGCTIYLSNGGVERCI